MLDPEKVIALVLVVVLLDLMLHTLRSMRFNKRLSAIEEQVAELAGEAPAQEEEAPKEEEGGQ